MSPLGNTVTTELHLNFVLREVGESAAFCCEHGKELRPVRLSFPSL